MRSSPLDVRVSGPLVPFRDGFVEELERRGYTPLSAKNQVWLLAHVSRWMASVGLDVGDLSEAQGVGCPEDFGQWVIDNIH
jgi:integrase/recombinase XerD